MKSGDNNFLFGLYLVNPLDGATRERRVDGPGFFEIASSVGESKGRVRFRVVAVIAIFIPSVANFSDGGKYSSADIAWIIVATDLVFLMTPGLAFFYGGMVHRKNVLSTMIKSFVATGIVSILWVTVGYRAVKAALANPVKSLRTVMIHL